MSHTTTGGRRGTCAAFAAIFATTMITTSACGTDTGTNAKDPVTAAPAAVQRIPAHPEWHAHAATSADAAERRGQAEVTPPRTGRPIPY